MAGELTDSYHAFMNDTHHSQRRHEKPINNARPTLAEPLNAAEHNHLPTPVDIARRAYFSYENQGLLPGHDLLHWLTAEAELIAKRKLARTHQVQKQAWNVF